ncbi:MAG: NAD(P)H-hydrate dehydratase [Gammaproteobacteria bacterium]|nr:NAD(P)H-hydrate dehydratase [Gammaproteobacteria bacterium]
MQNLPDNLYSVESVVQLEQIAINQYGIPAYELMKRAGAAVFNALQKDYPHCKNVLVLCGAGNNAGDGYVVARLAGEAGFNVEVVSLIEPAKLKNEAMLAYQDWSGLAENSQADLCLIDKADIVIDALLGTGLARDVSVDWAQWINAVNNADMPVISIDIPSGLLADTGAIAGVAIEADTTVSFIGLKQGMFTAQAKDVCGEVVFNDLGVPAEAYSQVECNTRLIKQVDYSLLVQRKPSSHKGKFGHVLIVGGNNGMPGAVILAATAALRAGAGLVTIIAAPQNKTAISAAVPEAMIRTCGTGTEDNDVITALFAESFIDNVTHVAVGMGLAQDDWAINILRHCLLLNKPMLIDADALNLLAKHDYLYSSLTSANPLVITPHPGEAARLLSKIKDTGTADVQANRFAAVRQLYALFNDDAVRTVILKGSGTLIYDGSTTKVCGLGNAAMSAPGMGDVLSGIVIALMAQHFEMAAAAELAVCLHASAAGLVSQGKTRGLLASDIIAALPEVLQ